MPADRGGKSVAEAAMLDFYHMGSEAFSEGRYDEARCCFERLGQLGLTFADVCNMLGTIAFVGGDLTEAEKQFRTALEINPCYTEASLNLAVTLNERGDYASAEAAFQAACQNSKIAQGELDPYIKGRLSNLHADIGEIYHGLGLHQEAVSEYEKALVLGPRFPDLRTRLGVLYRDMGEHEKAISEFSRVRDEHPAYAAALLQLGITHYSRGQIDLAVGEWNRILEKDPENAKALMYLKLVEKEA